MDNYQVFYITGIVHGTGQLSAHTVDIERFFIGDKPGLLLQILTQGFSHREHVLVCLAVVILQFEFTGSDAFIDFSCGWRQDAFRS
jgi:hypothetical protein